MDLRIIAAVPFLIALSAGFIPASAETLRQTLQGGMDIEIAYPDGVVAGRDFAVSFLIKNNGWEDKRDISVRFEPDESITLPESGAGFYVQKISASGSHGETVVFGTAPDASEGRHFLNVEYSHVLLENNETPREPVHANIAVPVHVKDEGDVIIHTRTPESIFAQAEFPFTVRILAVDADLRDVSIRLIPPKDIEFRGETLHAFSSVQRGETLEITSRITTPREAIQAEYRVPFQVVFRYTDDIGEQKEDSRTVSLVLRPRTFMEITTDGGIWVGDFFIAPYVSLGTIIGIPAGALFSLMVKRARTRRGGK